MKFTWRSAFHYRRSPIKYRLMRSRAYPLIDVAGVGINATDTVIELPRFPEFNSKLELSSTAVYPGGQVASALIACRRWGLSARYIGSLGDDAAARLQACELRCNKIESHLIRIPHCSSQLSYILVDSRSGERTILWKRDPRLTLRPRQLRREWVTRSKALLVDGHDTAAAAQSARWARSTGIPVVADVDNIYPGVEALLENADYLFAAAAFPERYFRKRLDFSKSLPSLARRFGCKVVGVTLGRLGALAWDGDRLHYIRGFRVDAVDTTGAGDIFHAGVVYGVLKNWPLNETLEFSCAAAALNCTARGARGGIKALPEIRKFMRTARRTDSTVPREWLKHTQQSARRTS